MRKTISWVDILLAAAVGIAAFVLLKLWEFPLVHPDAWEDVAIAAGLLPQNHMLPGLGQLLSHWIFAHSQFNSALAINAFLGKLTIAVSGALVYLALIGLMDLVAEVGIRDASRRRIAIRISAVVGAILFVFSNPVWTCAQDFTGQTVMVLLMSIALCAFARLMRTGKILDALLSLVATALFCAETPFAWVLLIIEVITVMHYLNGDTRGETEWADFLVPVRMQRTKWILTFAFLIMFALGAGLEIYSYIVLDGSRAFGLKVGDLPIAYCNATVDALLGASTASGWVGLAMVALLPSFISTLMVRLATSEEQFLGFRTALAFVFLGIIAYLQVSPFSFAWFWNVAGLGAVASKELLIVAMFLCALTVAWAIYVLCVELFCRDYEHIDEVLSMQSDAGDEDEDEEEGEDEEETERKPVKQLPQPSQDFQSVRLTPPRVIFIILPIVLLLLVIFGRRLTDDRGVCSIMNEFVQATITDLGNAKYLFTDGSYDAAYRLEAARNGKRVQTISLFAGNTKRDTYIRQVAAVGFDDQVTLESGSTEALKTWVTAKSERLSDVAVQLAFELFGQNKKLKPVVYGTLVRPVGGDEKEAAESFERNHRLTERIVKAHESGMWRHVHSLRTKDRMLFAQFRLAVMSRLRAICLDAAGKSDESKQEIAYSDRLNANNPSLLKILKNTDWVKRQTGGELTPREGLEVALKRADFVMARRYAMPILKDDADEPNANFAVGMSYYAEGQYAKAEDYLKKVLKRIPNEPAVLNNLALLYLKTGRLEQAAKYADEAFKLLPNSPEAKDTVRQVEKAIEKRRAK